jgi:hypothetical protein
LLSHNKVCDEYDPKFQRIPFFYTVSVEDPDEGDDLEICYVVKGSGSAGCKEFKFTGQNPQTVKLSIPDTDIANQQQAENFVLGAPSFVIQH